jgi:hypothetical protein
VSRTQTRNKKASKKPKALKKPDGLNKENLFIEDEEFQILSTTPPMGKNRNNLTPKQKHPERKP